MERTIAVALGSNLGDRAGHLAWAVAQLANVLSDLVISTPIETIPQGAGLENDPLYLNAVAVGQSDLSARELLAAVLDIERRRGRERPYLNAPRTLDLDLILVDDEVIDEPGLQVPHPRFRERRFVLEPLASIAPKLRDPITGLSVADLLARL